MRTFKMTVSYDGTNYCGWQVQCNGSSIQEQLEIALAHILCARVRVTASGRTDAGVHALGQVVSFVADTRLAAERLCRAINGRLPPDIRALCVEEAEQGFHAIDSARAKTYRYQFWDAYQHDVFRRGTHWHVRSRLDAERMQAAGRILIGRQDFAAFQSAGSPRASTVRQVTELRVLRPDVSVPEVLMEIRADGFLYNMVRNIAGSLVEVGRGVQPVEWIESVLQSRDRTRAGPTAPPHGLFLVSVEVGEPRRVDR